MYSYGFTFTVSTIDVLSLNSFYLRFAISTILRDPFPPSTPPPSSLLSSSMVPPPSNPCSSPPSPPSLPTHFHHLLSYSAFNTCSPPSPFKLSPPSPSPFLLKLPSIPHRRHYFNFYVNCTMSAEPAVCTWCVARSLSAIYWRRRSPNQYWLIITANIVRINANIVRINANTLLITANSL